MDKSVENDLIYWKLAVTYTFQEAILLMKGIAPEGDNSNLLACTSPDQWPKETLPLYKFIKTGVESGELKGVIVPEYYPNDLPIERSADISTSEVEGSSLENLLRNRGVIDRFFNTDIGKSVSYLDKSHPNYAPKLASAVKAWLAITNEPKYQKLGGPKKNAGKWLRDNAQHYGLAHEDGKLNESAIEEIAKIVNWNPTGGASKTPSLASNSVEEENEPEIVIKKSKPPTPSEVVAEPVFDSDIPF